MLPENMRDWVLLYHNKGFSVIPLKEKEKIPNLPSWNEYSTRKPTIEELETWLNDGLFQNLGVICGEVSNNLAVIDIDNKTIINDLNLNLEQIVNEGGLLVETNRGYHIYIKHKENPGDPRRDDKLHIEYRSNGNYVVAPPSIHPSGKQYNFMFLDENRPLDLKIKDAKLIFDNWVNALRVKNGLQNEENFHQLSMEISDIKKGVHYGERNVSAFKLACDYKNRGLSVEEVTKLMLDWNRNCKPPLHDRELLSCIKSAFKKPAKIKDDIEKKKELLRKYEVYELDEERKPTGRINCSRLARLLLENDNRNYLVTKDNQDIFIYNSSYYEPIGEGIIKERVQYYLDDLKSLEQIKKEVTGFIRNQGYIDRELFNPPLNLINFKNGIYDFEKQELIPHTPDYYFLTELPINFNIDSKCEKWLKFIEDIIYQEDKNFIQEFCGFLLYRKYVWALLVILLGHGRNGKSTFLKVLSEILGKNNVEQIPIQKLAHDDVAKARLFHKYGNLCADLGENDVKNTGNLKQLTGRDTIYARELYKQGFSFENFAKLIFACNVLPEIKDKTLAMTERLAVIEFPNEFKKDSMECDAFLYEKLTTEEELSGIVNWMLEGLQRLLKNKNFSTYRDFENVSEYHKQTQDPVFLFITECLEPDCNTITLKQEVNLEYKKFCEKNNYPRVSDAWLGRKLNQYFPVNWNITSGQYGKTTWKGLKIKGQNGGQKTL